MSAINENSPKQQQLIDFNMYYSRLGYEERFRLSADDIYIWLGQPSNTYIMDPQTLDIIPRLNLQQDKLYIYLSLYERLKNKNKNALIHLLDEQGVDLTQLSDAENSDAKMNDDKDLMIDAYLKVLIQAQRSKDEDRRIIAVAPLSPQHLSSSSDNGISIWTPQGYTTYYPDNN